MILHEKFSCDLFIKRIKFGDMIKLFYKFEFELEVFDFGL